MVNNITYSDVQLQHTPSSSETVVTKSWEIIFTQVYPHPNQLRRRYFTWWMAKQRKRQKTFETSFPWFHCGRHKQISQHLQTVRSSLQKHTRAAPLMREKIWLRVYGIRASLRRINSDRWCSGVASPSEGPCHVPPSSKRKAGSADIPELCLKPAEKKCLWTGSHCNWLQHNSYVTTDQLKGLVSSHRDCSLKDCQ